MRFYLTCLLAASMAGAALLSACSSAPPADPQDLCRIYQEKDSWYVAAHEVHDKYGVPIPVAMAIMYQESAYNAGALPPAGNLLPGADEDPEDLAGYVQPSEELWQRYQDEAGSMFSQRDDFASALDFIGWYMQQSRERCHIPYGDAYNQYLCFQEGFVGFSAGSYQGKDWLLDSARQCAARAEAYRRQLLKCELY